MRRQSNSADYMVIAGVKSNSASAWALFPRQLFACQAGQTTVEYLLLVAVLIVAMAASLEVLFGALSSLFRDLGGVIGQPYP